jgi:hypothetical protein
MHNIKPNHSYARMGDMDCKAALVIHMQPDGDLVVWVGSPYYPSTDYREVEFCSIPAGGGRSQHTREALKNLIEAIQKDNEENPIYINKHKVE